MKYNRFEDLPVWKAAVDLATKIYDLTNTTEFPRHRSLRDQLERAAVSVSNNIAEGFERGTTQELLTFIYIARGSAGEMRSMLSMLKRFPNFDSLRPQFAAIPPLSESISRQLRGWAESVQNSSVKGQRYLNAEAQRREQRNRERNE